MVDALMTISKLALSETSLKRARCTLSILIGLKLRISSGFQCLQVENKEVLV